MYKEITLFILLISFTSVKANTRDDRLLKLVDEEINTIKSIGSTGPKLSHRMVSLLYEKLKITNRYENDNILKKNIKLTHRNKRKVYPKSFELIKKIQKRVNYNLKMWPNFILNYDHYYILGLVYRDFINFYKGEKFFHKSLKLIPKNKVKELYKIRVTIAETYYNKKKYKSAIAFYNKIVSIKNEWQSKHYYNLSWCEFKTKIYKKALSQLLISKNLSNIKENINFEDQVLQSLPLFYAYAKKINEGLVFAKTLNGEEQFNFVTTLAKSANKKEKSNIVFQILKTSLNFQEDKSYKLGLMYELIKYNRLYKKHDNFFRNSKKLWNIVKSLKEEDSFFSSDLKLNIKEEIRSYVGYKQLRFLKAKNKSNKKLQQLNTYFEILKSVNKKESYKYDYFIAENYYSVNNFTSAFKYYKFSTDKALLEKDNDFIKKNFKSIFSLLKNIDNQKRRNDHYFYYAFNSYLAFNKKDKTAKEIYPKLYLLQFSNKEFKLCNKTLLTYIDNYPLDIKTQRNLYLKQFDHQSKALNILEVEKILKMINLNNFLSFSTNKKQEIQNNYHAILLNKALISQKQKDFKNSLNLLNKIDYKTSTDLKTSIESLKLKIILAINLSKDEIIRENILKLNEINNKDIKTIDYVFIKKISSLLLDSQQDQNNIILYQTYSKLSCMNQYNYLLFSNILGKIEFLNAINEINSCEEKDHSIKQLVNNKLEDNYNIDELVKIPKTTWDTRNLVKNKLINLLDKNYAHFVTKYNLVKEKGYGYKVFENIIINTTKIQNNFDKIEKVTFIKLAYKTPEKLNSDLNINITKYKKWLKIIASVKKVQNTNNLSIINSSKIILNKEILKSLNLEELPSEVSKQLLSIKNKFTLNIDRLNKKRLDIRKQNGERSKEYLELKKIYDKNFPYIIAGVTHE